MVGSTALVAQRGQYSAAVSSSVAVALLNLCLLLPLVIVVWQLSHVPHDTPLAKIPQAIIATDPPLFYPPSVWRVDAALLVVIGLWLLPISVGRWIPGRAEAVGLIIVYAAYLAMSAYANGRW